MEHEDYLERALQEFSTAANNLAKVLCYGGHEVDGLFVRVTAEVINEKLENQYLKF